MIRRSSVDDLWSRCAEFCRGGDDVVYRRTGPIVQYSDFTYAVPDRIGRHLSRVVRVCGKSAREFPDSCTQAGGPRKYRIATGAFFSFLFRRRVFT